MAGSFSERLGLKPIVALAQIDSMNDELRNGIWNILDTCFFSSASLDREKISLAIWWNYFKKPIDARPIRAVYGGGRDYKPVWREVRDYYFSCPWNEVYDFVEFMIPLSVSGSNPRGMLQRTLELENSAYRLINDKFSPIADQQEALEVQQAASASFPEAEAHFRASLSLLSDRINPDYRNSVKESISAVEAAARLLCGKPDATLGDALGLLEKSGALHGALKGGFSKLYGYTNDADGIRHSLMGESALTQADARYFLIVCSAFVNLLKVKGSV